MSHLNEQEDVSEQGDITQQEQPVPKQASKESSGPDKRSDEEKKADNELAEHLCRIIEAANQKCTPLCKMIRKNIESMFEKKEEDRDEKELVKNVKPLLEQAEKILNETNGSIRGADPNNRLSNKATRSVADHSATPEEQRLAEALKILVEEVGGTIEWARDKLDSFPKAKSDLGPLLDAMGQPLTQIVGGVGLLLTGVLNLVGKLLSGLGLDGFLKGLVGATGLDKMYKGLGLDKLM
ncbi:hypothetical protein DFH06DRAFT_1345320 [Mycena polygramma]|nr:hypothetical protein DFH06DRAFT_1345320 [Mycena polygramma]